MTPQLGPPTLAEDLLLLLARFRPGTEVAGEQTLAGAVLADLSLGGHLRTVPGRGGSTRVEAVAERPPADDVLRSAWDYLRTRPRDVQAALVGIGPTLRSPLLDRLVRRGDLRRPTRGAPGSVDLDALEDEGSGRRAHLLSGVREVLVDRAAGHQRIVVLAALLSASGTLRRFDPRIPWTPPVIARAEELERDVWAALAIAEAVARTAAAALVSNVILAAAVLSGGDRRFTP